MYLRFRIVSSCFSVAAVVGVVDASSAVFDDDG